MNPNGSIQPISVNSLKSWLIDWLAKEFEMDPRTIDPAQTFLSHGVDSVQAMSMVGDLEARFSRRLPPTLAWDYPTIDALAEHLAERLGVTAVLAVAPARSVVASIRDASRADIESLLAGLDQLGEQDVDRLLTQYLGESS